MKKKSKQERINDCLREVVDTKFKLVKDYVKPHIGNKDAHEIAKFKKCLELMRDGKEIYTEVRFKDGKGRCDILIPEAYQVVEILHSESEEEALSKVSYYPSCLDIIFIKSEEILGE